MPGALAISTGLIGVRPAAHESLRTTALYDWRDDGVAVDEVKKIVI